MPFSSHQDLVESRGKAVDAYYFITNKAQLDTGVTNFKIWGERLESNEGFWLLWSKLLLLLLFLLALAAAPDFS